MTTIKFDIAGPRGLARRAAMAVLIGGLLSGIGSSTNAADSATVFMYHRFGEKTHPTTNIRIDQFEAHIGELTNGKLNPLGLPRIDRTF